MSWNVKEAGRVQDGCLSVSKVAGQAPAAKAAGSQHDLLKQA
ncbi:MAG: hypothetical protein GFH27_549423n23 [Chloroflexi bacterium AL-W]|nr:hypothetical protein [Chloroflexi bacterium AL-N1]NOK71527.1 hypothetical protein [Chloroflexi bacterium AL-N10]NOK78873.1 hypothetical protein [Chloroflexi bacterium AL-N5]NOK86349.1 hypothetical protein [Chloroflexi bacterium AL-W]NOK93318.1 hypothetical protein [Chloroflexi bacterium AL-N15]